ncbi:MAG TPA: PAS domain-containing sensor histidine kinase [Cyclobacteriaceae bacterium]
MLGLVVYQVYLLINFLEKSNRELVSFLESIKYDDFSHSYPEKNDGSSLDALYTEFNAVIRKFREIRAEKEAQYQYLKTIVQHVGIGIVTINKDGDVQIINSAAKKLLGINQLRNINQLKSESPELVTSIRELKTGGRDLIKISRKGEEIQLSIYAIQLTMQSKEFKLISIQNIQSELEEKEMEAWQNLIRVLTHEIMNSVTPISSLASTVESELDIQLKNDFEINKITNEEIEDLHLAVSTIHRRSDSLIKFVNDFRNMTRITVPKLAMYSVSDLVDHVINLHRYDIENANINLKIDINPSDLQIYIDMQQIEQVIINLVKNSIQALSDMDDPEKEKQMTIKANAENEKVILCVSDNGPGIEEEALKKIFIPFFTTKKNGSGIGLSLSKQIMRIHKGSISVNSVINEGTTFKLQFNSQ